MTNTAEPNLLILDDYTSSSSTLVDFSPLLSSHPSLKITTQTSPIPPEDLISTLKPYVMIHAMRERTKLTRSTLEQLPNLKFITTTAMKNAGIDLVACEELGIQVSGTTSSGTGANGTVEQTWGLILGLSRRIVKEHANVRDGSEIWQTGVATGLRGKQLGVIGVGRLGKEVANVAKAFGMKVVGWSPNLTRTRAEEAGVELAGSLEDLLKTSDVVTLHMVLSEKTKGLIGKKELDCLKPTSFLVNTSRGPLIDEGALVEVLREGKIKGAGLDVFDVEPLPKDHPLRTMNNVVLSPHMGYVETPQYQEWWQQTIDNVDAFLLGKPIRLLQ
ncbi:hypothetical protein JCM5353_001120 [Sporobolomyces roseus]